MSFSRYPLPLRTQSNRTTSPWDGFVRLLALVPLLCQALLGAPVIFDGPNRQGAAKDGVVHARWGVEQTMLFEDGVFKSWYHGAPDSGGDYWNNPVIRYATSPDGVNWTDHGVCVGNTPYFRACHFVYHLMEATQAGEAAGYYMPVGRNGQFGFDLFYSTTGLPGTWSQLNNGNLILGLGPANSWDEFRTGNICIWYENNQWQVMYEAADVPPAQKGTGSGWFSWRIGYAYGPSLTNLTRHPGNPVMFNSTFSPTAPAGAESSLGGPDVHKVGDTYYAIIHETDPRTRHKLTPTSCALYKSTNLINWERLGWMARIWVNKGTEAQVADASMVSVNGKTYLWYEDQPDQTALLPSLGLMTWDMPFEELVQRPDLFEDTEAGGWAFETGFGEVPSANGSFPTTYFRKLNVPISPHCVAAKTDASHELRVRKPIPAGETEFAFAARAEQTNRKFTPLRIDANANNTVLAGVIFDADGQIKYYNGASLVAARAYEARRTYNISYVLAPSGYALRINDELVADNIPYASAYAAPAFYKLELTSGATGYVGTVMNPLPEPAGIVTWAAPANISAEADVATQGTPVFAYTWKGAPQTVNGVAFTAPGGGVSTAGFYGTFAGFADNAAVAGGMTTAYRSVIGGGRYTDTLRPATVTLNGLVPGRKYVVQLWVNDSRALGATERTETVTSGGNTVTLRFPANTAGGLGQSVTGTFTADNSAQTITLNGNASSQINAIQLREFGFKTWSDVNAPDQSLNEDHDHDGVSNGIEYFMGSSGSGFTPGPAVSGNTVIWTKGTSYPGAYGADYEVQESVNLTDWTAVDQADLTFNPGSVSCLLPEDADRWFARLKVTGP